MQTIASFRQRILTDRETVSSPPTTDRLSWIWLAIGAVLLPFAGWQTVIPLAAWLAPVFLMRFTRTQRAIIGLPIVLIVSSIATIIAWRDGLIPLPPSLVAMFGLIYGLLFALPYGADRLLAPRLSGLTQTLVFPLAVTTLSYALPLIPVSYATWGAPAYSQYGNLPLLQLVSVTGIWGLTFLISWLAPALNALWEQGFTRSTVLRQGLPFALTLLLVVLFGSARLALTRPDAATVRVAGIATDTRLRTELEGDMNTLLADIPGNVPVWAKLAGASDSVRATMRAEFAPIIDDLFARSEREARAGARIVSWSENGGMILKEDETAVIARAQAIARAEGIYLQLGLLVSPRTEQWPFAENRLVLIDPTGSVVWDYAKSHPVPGGESAIYAPGPGRVPTARTPYGRLAGVICFDLDYPATPRQAGEASADILFAPSSDWESEERFTHAEMATFRAIENGVALVRPTSSGVSIAVDARGQVLASADSYATEQAVMVTYVPTRGTPTLYARFGDWFAYLCAVGLLALAALALVRRSAEPASAPLEAGS